MQNECIEEWRPVCGYEGKYEVSNLGRVRSLTYGNQFGTKKRKTPLLMSLINHKGGGSNPAYYKKVTLKAGGGKRDILLHRLVLEAFVGPCPEGMEGAHLDGNPQNNRLDNLAWVTHQENCDHQSGHGTRNHGERNGQARLTEDIVRNIRADHGCGESMKDLSVRYAVSYPHIKKIIQRTRWKHVE